jgi:hypothetical protein
MSLQFRLELSGGKENLLDRVHASRLASRLRPATLVGRSGNDPVWDCELVGCLSE